MTREIIWACFRSKPFGRATWWIICGTYFIFGVNHSNESLILLYLPITTPFPSMTNLLEWLCFLLRQHNATSTLTQLQLRKADPPYMMLFSLNHFSLKLANFLPPTWKKTFALLTHVFSLSRKSTSKCYSVISLVVFSNLSTQALWILLVNSSP